MRMSVLSLPELDRLGLGNSPEEQEVAQTSAITVVMNLCSLVVLRRKSLRCERGTECIELQACPL
jgi:hypothetical protein